MKKLPDSLRSKLREPLGELHPTVTEALSVPHKLLVTVGDVTTAEVLKRGKCPDVAIFDGKVMRKPAPDLRKPIEEFNTRTIRVRNPAGHLNPEIEKILTSNQPPLKIEVEGEEDLTVLACAKCLPLGTLILYGQPGEGVVAVKLTEQKKEELTRLLDQLEIP